MQLLLLKLLLALLVIIVLAIYFHIGIKDSFFNLNVPSSTRNSTDIPISMQLIEQIASKLNISQRRIQNLEYDGDLAQRTLKVLFTIMEPNIIEQQNREVDAKIVASSANNLFKINQFIVVINGSNIILQKLSTNTETVSLKQSNYFNNADLLEVAKYSTQKYQATPSDSSLTNFYKLTPDTNFNLQPTL